MSNDEALSDAKPDSPRLSADEDSFDDEQDYGHELECYANDSSFSPQMVLNSDPFLLKWY